MRTQGAPAGVTVCQFQTLHEAQHFAWTAYSDSESFLVGLETFPFMVLDRGKDPALPYGLWFLL
jgi:hypothetical protein